MWTHLSVCTTDQLCVTVLDDLKLDTGRFVSISATLQAMLCHMTSKLPSSVDKAGVRQTFFNACALRQHRALS